MEELKAHLRLRAKQLWTIDDIQLIAQCKRTKAGELFRRIKRQPGGSCEYNSRVVHREVALKILKLNAVDFLLPLADLKLLEALLNGGKGGDRNENS